MVVAEKSQERFVFVLLFLFLFLLRVDFHLVADRSSSACLHDQLSFTPTPLMSTDTLFPSTSPGKELQYKLGDSSVTFFAKGTGYGFL